MLKAEELRIGNILAGGVVVRINSENNRVKLKNTSTQEGQHFPLEELVPEELTEEWLKDFGFEKDGKEYRHPTTMLFQLFNVTTLEGGFRIIAGRRQSNVILQISDPLHSVHQLQSLYFALCGEELTIKEKV